MNTTTPREVHWAHRGIAALLAPFRLVGDILFCGFVVFAAFWMLLLCTMLATLDHLVFEPWKLHHPAR
ncbi:MAG TPA: hypothetical protein VHY09_10515 [Candidatus Methylacidiphilales bacterium]|jgi:hypothetical protein|nr:hypothetical protein [Candidatus Methylacidiphilales bacterium]